MTTQDAVPGPQREPDERVREALAFVDANANLGPDRFHRTLAAEVRRLQAAQREPVAEVYWPNRSLAPGVTFFGAWPDHGTKLYTHPQRDDHPTEGLLREALIGLRTHNFDGAPCFCGASVRDPRHTPECLAARAALAASKGTPDSMGHGQPLPSLSVDTSVANPHDSDCATHNEPALPNGPCDCSATVDCPDCGGMGRTVQPLGCGCCSDWAMCETCEWTGRVPAPPADVRSQAKEKP